jgi:uncharacterized protein (TIGR02391 family)
MRALGVQTVVVIHNEGQPDERRGEMEAHVQPGKGLFEVDAPIYEGDVVELRDPRGGIDRRHVNKVEWFQTGRNPLNHIEVTWSSAAPVRRPPIERATVAGLHALIKQVSGDLYVDRHYDQAIFEAFKAVEVRVRQMSGLDASGRDLMATAFGDNKRIVVRGHVGRSGSDEQEGWKLIFMGAMQGIRNPKGHEQAGQMDAEVALEYLTFASLLMRKLDEGAGRPTSPH